MRYQDVNSNLVAHIQSLRLCLGILAVFVLLLGTALHYARTDLRIHIPPDLRSGAMVRADQIAPPNVYAFAYYIFQQLNHWPERGDQDYGQQIFKMASYLTPAFIETLKNDLELRGKRGELSSRTRSLAPILGHGYAERRVVPLTPETWVVWLDLSIQETVRGMPVKSVQIRYPLRVVHYDVDPEVNPWGLALDGFAGDGPVRIKVNADGAIDDPFSQTPKAASDSASKPHTDTTETAS